MLLKNYKFLSVAFTGMMFSGFERYFQNNHKKIGNLSLLILDTDKDDKAVVRYNIDIISD